MYAVRFESNSADIIVFVCTSGKIKIKFFLFCKIDANRLNTEIQLNLQSPMPIQENCSQGNYKRLCMRYVEYWRTISTPLFHICIL